MSGGLKRLRSAMVDKLLGIELGATVAALQQSIERQAEWEREARHSLALLLESTQADIAERRVALDDIPSLRAKLKALRATPAYSAAFDDVEPLVTVRIHTYTKTEELMDLALPSVLGQTYERIEIVIVNDGPNERTRSAVTALNDDRVRFEELPTRGRYPENPRSRWMVAGTDPANRAIELAQGTWLAPLDDDDEFTPDHIETLLSLARSQRVELAYGALIQKNLINGDEARIWSFPPAINQFSFQGSFYLGSLSFFRYEPRAWMLSEPGDWNLIRRMSEAGVTMAATEEVVAVTNMVPYTHKSAD
ncbi:hypothetical protein BH11ACT4_BH11ACT4_02080 [soil metagenome]